MTNTLMLFEQELRAMPPAHLNLTALGPLSYQDCAHCGSRPDWPLEAVAEADLGTGVELRLYCPHAAHPRASISFGKAGAS